MVPSVSAEEAISILKDFCIKAMKGVEGEPRCGVAVEQFEDGWVAKIDIEVGKKKHGFQTEPAKFANMIFESGKALERLSKKFGGTFKFPEDVFPKKILSLGDRRRIR